MHRPVSNWKPACVFLFDSTDFGIIPCSDLSLIRACSEPDLILTGQVHG